MLTLRFDQTGHIVDCIDITTPRNPITLTAPRGGTTQTVGDELVVEWSCITTLVNDVHIEYSADGGQNWEDLSSDKLGSSIDENHAEWGNFTYTITPAMVSTMALVRVREYGGSRTAVSSVFSVAEGSGVGMRRAAQPVAAARSVVSRCEG